MSWRIIIISGVAKLDLQLGFIMVRQEKLTRIHISEVHTLIIESTAVSLTAALLQELMIQKVKVIFCDAKRNPSAELIPYYGSHDSSLKIQQQISWATERKEQVWVQIIKEKIIQQSRVLEYRGKEKEALMLQQYASEVQVQDSSNREGHSAKVYFNALFGMQFKRGAEGVLNSALNYGYSILLSAFNREIAASGYLTQCGLAHRSRFNPFNLASDLMEPYRPLVDRVVCQLESDSFGRSEKDQLVDIMHQEVFIEEKRQLVHRAINLYVRSVFDSLNTASPLSHYSINHD